MANGTIAFDTLSTSGQISGTAVSVDADYLAYGSAKAWIHVAKDGASTLDSFNISSHDDDGTGDGGVNINNDMSNNDYAISSMGSDAGANNVITNITLTEDTEATGSFDYETAFNNTGADRTNLDTSRMMTIQGDLA